jgi:pilus assembly protein Flp/PilA
MTAIHAFLANEDAATAVEYALMLALIASVIVLAVQGLGTAVNDRFESMATSIQS